MFILVFILHKSYEMPNSELLILSGKEQDAAAFLRERYLVLIASLLANKPCKINMHNGTEVFANIRSFDTSSEHILVENLKPPLQTSIHRACLRTSDIISISYEEI